MTDNQKIKALKEYFEKRDDVVMAFLFGSRAKGYARVISDWDIGIYITEEDRAREQEIWTATERIVERNVDLVILNRAPASVAWSVVRVGAPLSIKNRRLYFDFLFSASDEANAWYATSRHYFKVFERSRSLTPEDADRIRRLIAFMEESTREYIAFQAINQQQYQNDLVTKRNIEHWIEHLVVAAVDIAEIILASERRMIPSSYREIVRELASVQPFGADQTCERLSEWVQLRNLLAHEYLDYRWKEISAFLAETQQPFLKFIDTAKKFLEEAPPAEGRDGKKA